MQLRLPLLTCSALFFAGPAVAQTTLMQMDQGNLSQAWSLTSPNAGPNDWLGVAYLPPLEFPFRVVSATMHYIDTFCCQTLAPACDATCGVFDDWERRVITGPDLLADPAGLTPDLLTPLVNQSPVGQSPPAFTTAGSTFTSTPWTLSPDVWSFGATTVFDRPGRLFYVVKYFNGDQWMRFVADDAALGQHASHRAIFTNNGFATRSAIWGFGNIGMRVTVAPIFFVKPATSQPAARVVLSQQTSVTMLSVRVQGGNASTLVSSFAVDGSGSGHDALGVQAVRLVHDLDLDGVEDPGEPVLASGTFASDNGRVTLSPNRTLATGAAEEWLVVYDLSAQPLGGHTFSAAITGPARISSNLGAPYVSSTPSGTGAINGTPITVAGTLQVSAGPASPAARVVAAGSTGLPLLQLRLTANNEAFNISGLTVGAQGSVNDLTEVTGVRLYRDDDASGTVNAGEPQLASGTFSADDGQLAFSFGAQTVPANQSRDLLVVVDLSGAAAGGDGIRALLAASADIVAAGAASGALPTTGPRALTGAPVIGELVTVGGALLAQVGAASMGNGTAQPGSSNVPMLQLTFSAQAEDVRLSTLSFVASGIGNEPLDVARAQLMLDTNANGLVDAADVQAGLPQSYASDDGVLTFALSNQVVPTAGARSFLLAYDFSANPTGGETFSARLVDATAVVASGQASGAPVTATGSFPLVGRTVTLLGGLSVTVGPENPAAARVQPGALDVPVLQLSAVAQGETFTVAQLTLTAAGSLLDATSLSAVRIYRDQGVPGQRDTPDVLLATSSYALDDGRATFIFNPALSLNPSTPERWLVTYDVNTQAAPGQTFRASVAAASDVLATGTLSGPASLSGLPAVGADMSIGGGLRLSVGPVNPTGGRLVPGVSAQPMLQFRVEADLEPISIRQVTVRGSGTGNELTGVQGARLYVDSNADGLVDQVGDVALAGPSPFGQNDGALSFTLNPPRTLAAATSEIWLVAYDLGLSPQAGETFQLAVISGLDVLATAPSGPLPGAVGAPVAGGARTVLGDLSVARGPNSPTARTVTRGAQAVGLLQVRLTSVAEAFSLSRLNVHTAGSMDDVADLDGLSLLWDVDGSGTQTAADVPLAGPLPASGDDGQVSFTGLSVTVPSGGSVDLLVTADLSGQAAGGAGLRLLVRDAADLGLTGIQGRIVSTVAGLPISSDTITAGGTLQVGLGANSPLGRVARRGDTAVPGLQLRFVSNREPVTLTQVVLHGSGTGHEVSGLVGVELWLDADADGLVSGGEPRLAVGTFSADDGPLTLALNQAVQVGPALHLLATYSLSQTPIGAETFRLSFNPAQDLTFTSPSGAVQVEGGSVTGGFVTVGGGFQVAPGPNNGAGGLVNQATQNLGVMQAELTAVNERCTVEVFTVRAAGGIDDAADITGARLVLDANQDGVYQATDPLIAGPLAFTDDDAELSFSGINRSLAPNVSERWLLVYDLSGQASNLETFSARVEAPSRVQVRCQVSGLLTPVGAPVQGAVFTVQEDGALVLRRGAQTPPPRFLPEGTVRAPILQIRAAASVQPLTLDRLTLTASVSAPPVSAAVAGVDLFLDVNQDGQLDRSDQLIASGGAPNAAGQVAFTGIGLALPLDEAQFLLAAINVAPGATPGVRISLGIRQDSDAVASSGFGPALTTGAPVSSHPMTVAGGLNVRAGRAEADRVVSNDAHDEIALDLVAEATWETFTLRRLTVTAQGSMEPSTAVRGLSLVVDEDGDGGVSAGDTPLASGLTFPEGESRATFDLLTVAIPAGTSRRLLVVLDLDGVARVDQTLQLALASDLDLVAEGDRRGLSSPVGAPVTGDTFTVGASLRVAAGASPPVDDVVTADAVRVPVLQLSLQASNEDVTLARLALTVAGTLNDATGISAVRLFRDQDGDGLVDPEDIEIGAPARPAGDDGVITFGPLSERLAQNEVASLLVTVDLSGAGSAGQDLSLQLASDADVTAFGARSGAVAARGAPIQGARLSLMGAMNVRLGPASPAGQGVWPGTAFGGLQLEFFTRGEAVTLEGLTLTLSGGTGVDAVAEVRLVQDLDGDGLAGEGEPELGRATVQEARLGYPNLNVTLGLNASTRLVAEVILADDAQPGETIRLAVAAAADIQARGASTGALVAVGPPVLGSAFTVTRPPEVTGGGQESGGCSCNGAEPLGASPPPWASLGLVLMLLLQLRRLTRKES